MFQPSERNQNIIEDILVDYPRANIYRLDETIIFYRQTRFTQFDRGWNVYKIDKHDEPPHPIKLAETETEACTLKIISILRQNFDPEIYAQIEEKIKNVRDFDLTYIENTSVAFDDDWTIFSRETDMPIATIESEYLARALMVCIDDPID